MPAQVPTNRLAAETSPYLLQHAHNPVDWYPWGPEGLERARQLDRPIFLSIGYAACHWCHVMERESFEDEATADKLNASFIAIKVDREERPDLDAIYMEAVQAMTGQGGWPMSVFLTPDGRPFYGGTYFPNDRRHGLPSFGDVLDGISRAWQEQRPEIDQAASRLVDAVRPVGPAAGRLSTELLDAAVAGIERGFDAANGGWGRAPKFPQPMTIELLLREHVRIGDEQALAMAQRSLDAMAAGGIYDHVGGGFARYATDAVWLVPHFEKMLYDNAQLARAYLHAWQLTGAERYREVVRETLDFVLRELRTADGGFASSLDADTEGEEGATYVWSADEIQEILGAGAPLFLAAYGVQEGGNWEGHTILSRVLDASALAARFGGTAEAVERQVRDARERLRTVRDRRPQPARDDKVLAAWNGLMLAALAEASAVLEDERYRAAAETAGAFLLDALLDEGGRLKRSWKDGRALHAGVLEDHANLAEGLLALYSATFDDRWFLAARALAQTILEHFADPAGGFFDTADDAERLIARPKGLQDNALPSGNAMAALVLLRLAALTGEDRYRTAAEQTLSLVAEVAPRYPTAFAQWLIGIGEALVPIAEVAIIGERNAPDTHALVSVTRRGFRPFQVVASRAAAGGGRARDAAGADPAADEGEVVVPLLRDRPMVDGRATAYVCHNFACQRPVTEPSELERQLDSVRPPAASPVRRS